MSGILGTLRALIQRLARNWAPKLVTLVIAFLIWVFVTGSSATMTQRSMILPLQVDGVDEGAVAVGLPESIAVSVSGPSLRVDRLNSDMLRASLDLTGASGEFVRPIVVQSPQDVRVLQVEPAEVIGFLEAITSTTFGVTVALTGAPPSASVLEVEATPASVTLTGRSQVLDSVTRVLALAPASGGGQARLVALDGTGTPVVEVEFEPPTVDVTTSARAVLVTTEVTIDLGQTPPPALAAPNLAAVTLDTPSVTVAGPPDALEGLTEVLGTVDAPTGTMDPGRYTLPVRLTLPEGVVAMQAPTATLVYVQEPLEP